MGLTVGTWQVNTEDEAWLALTHQARIDHLRDAVQKFWAALDVAASPLPFPALFVAPEYTFVKGEIGPRGHHGFTCHHLEQAEHEMWRQELWRIHRAHPRVALVPGTILWRKPCDRVTLQKLWRQHHDSLPRSLSAAAATCEASTSNSRREQGKKARFLGLNEAWIFLGQAAIVHNKLTDVSEAWDPEETLQIGGNEPVITRFNDQWLGLEVCRDHTAGALKSSLRGRQVDLHLILSAHLDEPFLKDFRCGSHLVHACSLSKVSGVFAASPRQIQQQVETTSGYPVIISTLPD